MSKLTAALPLLLVAACDPSNQEIQDTATITCNTITESNTLSAVKRAKEINAAREKIGADTFLGRDADILLSFKHGLCESLVKNDDGYETRLASQQKQEALGLTEHEQAQINREKSVEVAKIKAKRNHERLQDLVLEEKNSIAAEKKTYWKERTERIAATDKIRIREEQLVAYWRSLDKAQWEELYPQQTSIQKHGWKRCETIGDSEGKACKKNWRRLNYRWRQVVKERMSYWDTLTKSDRGQYLN